VLEDQTPLLLTVKDKKHGLVVISSDAYKELLELASKGLEAQEQERVNTQTTAARANADRGR